MNQGCQCDIENDKLMLRKKQVCQNACVCVLLFLLAVLTVFFNAVGHTDTSISKRTVPQSVLKLLNRYNC